MEDEPEPVVDEKMQLLRDDLERGSNTVNSKLRIDIFSLLCYNSGKEEARILLRKSKFLEAFVTLKIKQGLL